MNERKLKIKKLDALYITHNPLDCFIVYFCLCFTMIHIVHTAANVSLNLNTVYLISLVFSFVLSIGMAAWAKKTVKKLKIDQVL